MKRAMPDRPSFLRGLVSAGAALVALAGPGAGALGRAGAAAGPSKGDREILVAAQIAEALAVTTYGQIVATTAFFNRLFPQDQAYLRAARQQEMAHYALLQSLTGVPSPYTSFFYPKGMFTAGQVTLNTLVTLEEAFIAAYLVGVRNLSTADLRVAAARIMGVESDHRTMARVLAPGLDPADGGPLRTVSGIEGVAEAVDPANDNGYERTLGWTAIDRAVAALLPFVDKKAAAGAHFDTTKEYAFQPFTPTLMPKLGAF
jgi:hypothetical protein